MSFGQVRTGVHSKTYGSSVRARFSLGVWGSVCVVLALALAEITVYPSVVPDASSFVVRILATFSAEAGVLMVVAALIRASRPTVRAPDRETLSRELRDAIAHDELAVHYQLKAHLRIGSAAHVEALVRWHRPGIGDVPAEEVIAIAERADLMTALSTWVLDSALRQCHLWRESGMAIGVAVNMSAHTLHDPALVGTIDNLLRKWRLQPSCLEVEITEGALMVDPTGTMSTLEHLHEMGVSISIDDFGTGYSSLSYLTRLPADKIKIDKTFVLAMSRHQDTACIVRSVIELGHNLRLHVVAEGVEDQETWDLLTGMGCDSAQGYHLSYPMPAVDAGRWLSEYNAIMSPA